ncbi:ABC transporter ATP-binding protein [Spiroplasma eriocheiris]|uniref:ABC transporter ATP-binding protein n=1 Tax=Spiroplasma eriocheiris TaxID=315358 RepID=A0A0H3XKL3_9MOLU|nr:ABC transporter ATP-binding protein [Spiroplasma eriocheiris]AHF58024.1 putative ABC-type transport system ATP-binding protein [Spiroplasma eriocheiris CCTCC M 207170]AKM54466.1 ABC transporter ATP-binding protein [Spiroplasma eriocheiris]
MPNKLMLIPTIQVTNFQKKFKKNIVGPFNFIVHSGKMHAILGASGSGKTVLIKSLIGGLKGFKGNITINGYKNNAIKIKKRIGYVPEFLTFPEKISAYNFLKYLGRTNGLRGSYLKNRIKTLMMSLDLWEFRDRDVNSFSSGMKKRIMIIQGIIHDPDIIILDEPESGLDIDNRKKIIQYLKRLTLQGKTVFFSSHLLDEIKNYIDEFTMIMMGKQYYTGSIKKFNLQNTYALTSNNQLAIQKYFQYYRIPSWYEAENRQLNFVIRSPLDLYYITQYALQYQIKIYKIKEVEFSFNFLFKKLNIKFDYHS